MDRRAFVHAVTSAGALVVSGCAGTDSGPTSGDPPTEIITAGNQRDRPTETTEHERQNESATPEPAETRTPFGEPPRARIDTSQTQGPSPLTVTFDGRGSVDPDGEIVEYIWLFKDMRPPATGPVVEHTFTSEGATREVELVVTDDNENTARATVDIHIESTSR